MTVRQAFAIFGFVGFFASLLVHLTTFFGIDLSRSVPWVWVLHMGIFVLFIPMLIVQGVKPKKDYWNKLLADMPRWAGYALKFFFVYVPINFLLFIFLARGGVPEERDGKYVLNNHGTITRELSEVEYEWQKAYVLRGFSGHWMIFYLAAALVLLYKKSEPESP